MTRRGYSLTEVIAATALALVMIPALFPSPRSELAFVRERYEAEAARLILEGELARAQDQANRGELVVGSADRPTDAYGSAEHLKALRLERRVSRRAEGGFEVMSYDVFLPSRGGGMSPPPFSSLALLGAGEAP